MKVATALVFLVPFFSQVMAQGNQRNQGNQGGNGNQGNGNQGNGNQGNGNQGNAGQGNAGQGNAGQGNAGQGNAGQGAEDPQTSLTLDPAVIAQGFANNGQDPPVAGQVASLTSTNNFINFCLTVNAPITDGKQIDGGSCNPAPIGVIPSVDRMPSAKFTSPLNNGFVEPNQQFTVSLAINNLVTGQFVNAQTNYFAAPQQLQGGTILGHSHIAIELLTSLTQTTPTNPKEFAFFKGLNGAAQNGIVTADVTDGLAAGTYRMCTINSSSNHQPVIVPIAQHGSLDDCIYFTAGAAPAANDDAAAGGAANGGAANDGAANGGAANGDAEGGAANGGAANGGAANGEAEGGAANGGAANGGAANGGAANGGAANGGAANGGAANGGAANGGANGGRAGAGGAGNNRNGGRGRGGGNRGRSLGRLTRRSSL